MSQQKTPYLGGEIIIYQAEGDSGQIRVLLEGETVWLTQRLMSE